MKRITKPGEPVVIEDSNGITTCYIGDDRCPYCGASLEMATDAKGEGNVPSSGSLMICNKCIQIACLDDSLCLQKLPVEEYLALPEEDRAELERVRRALKAFNKVWAEQRGN